MGITGQIRFVNFCHVAKEVRGIGINHTIYQKYIEYILKIRDICGGKNGCGEVTHKYLQAINAELNAKGKKFTFLTTPFYYERTIGSTSFDDLQSLLEVKFIGTENCVSISTDWLVVHMNCESLKRAPDLLAGYTGMTFNMGKLFEDQQLVNNIGSYDAKALINATKDNALGVGADSCRD